MNAADIHASTMSDSYDSSIMQAIGRSPILLVVAAFAAVGALYLWERSTEPHSLDAAYSSTDLANTYANSTYGYSLSYPSGYASRELKPMFAEIMQNKNGTFVEAADIATLYATVQDPIPSMQDFVTLSAGLACDTSGASPVKCTGVASSAPFTTESGVSGTELYFNSNAGVRGPYFTFDITRNVPNASYAVLLVYPPPQLAASNADRTLLQQIASSLRIAYK